MSGSDAYYYLCFNCGSITPFKEWRLLVFDEGYDRLVLAPPGSEDPVCECPICKWHHIDGDSNPGIMDSDSERDLELERLAALPVWGDRWLDALKERIDNRRALAEEQFTQINIRDDVLDKIRAVAKEQSLAPELWLQRVIEERLLGNRAVYGTFVERGGPIEELYLAIVHLDDGSEDLLLWRVMTELGEQMIPVFARTEEGVQRWLENIGFEIGSMDGPELSFRHFPAAKHLTWLRRNPDPSMPDSEQIDE